MKLVKYIFLDIVKNKTLIIYTVFLWLVGFTVFQLEGSSSKGVISLLNVVLIAVPLVSMVFSTIHYYNSNEYIQLLLSQPIKRSKVYIAEFLGLSAALSFAFLVGIGIPLIRFAPNAAGFTLMLSGLLLTWVSVSLALLGAVFTPDKAKGIGISLLLWFYFSLLYDGLVLALLFALREYPIEQFIVAFASFNPVDLARILILLQLDISALMGITGALYQNFFGSGMGVILAVGILLLWAGVPSFFAYRFFLAKDF